MTDALEELITQHRGELRQRQSDAYELTQRAAEHEQRCVELRGVLAALDTAKRIAFEAAAEAVKAPPAATDPAPE